MPVFPLSKRLNKKSDFDNAFELSKKFVTANFIFFYKKNSKTDSRLGLIVPKKKISKAHERNRTKRLIRESFRCAQLPAVDIIVLVKKDVTNMANYVLTEQIGEAWEKITKYS